MRRSSGQGHCEITAGVGHTCANEADHRPPGGQAHLGVFEDGGARKCEGTGSTKRCVYLAWPETWFAYVRPQFSPTFWHGTVLHDKQDATGTHYRRNRYYDPSTGRFTQEDPLGLGGGVNTYGFAEGDPVNYGDPYGLKVCYEGTPEQRKELVEATELATNTRITLDKANCISRADPNPQGQNRWFRSLQRRLGNVIRDPDTHVLAFGEDIDTNVNPFNNRITFVERTFTEEYVAAGGGGYGCKYGQRNQPYSAPAAVAHELLGHAEAPGLRQIYQPRAIDVENEYHRAVGEATRCRWE